MVVQSPTPFGLGQNCCWPSEGCSFQGTPPNTNHFSAVLPPDQPGRRATRSLFKIRFLSSPFSCLCHARLLVLLLLLMSGNVHPNSCSVVPCLVYAGNVTWRGRSVQCYTCLKWVHLKCLLLSFSRFRALGSSQSWRCPPCLRPWFFWRSHTYQHCDFLFKLLQLTYLYCLIWFPLLIQHSRPTLAFKPVILFLPTSYFFPLHSHHRLMLLAVSLYLLLTLLLPDSLRVLQWNAEISKPVAINFLTLFCLILLTLFVSMYLTLTYLPLSGSLDTLLCDLIAPTPGLIFFLLMSHTLAAVSSFSSGRAYPSLNFLPPLFLRLIPTLIM